MRVIVFFDLPVETAAERKVYRQFRKLLIAEGFIMMQESIYSKLALNNTTADLIKNRIRKNGPARGLVQMMTITEKQYSSIEFVTGSADSKILDSTNRMIIL